MEPLADALRRVEELRRDLSTEIVIQEAEGGYYEIVQDSETGNVQGHEEWIPSKPAVTEPDTQKREAARA